MYFLSHAWLVPLITFASFWVILLFGKRLPKKGSEVGVLALAITFAFSCACVYQWSQRADAPLQVHQTEVRSQANAIATEAQTLRPPVDQSVTWFSNGQAKVKAGIHIDGVAVMMLFVVTLISFMVHIFSTGYMRGDRRYTYFFAALSLFTTGMLVLVTASNTLQMLFGWELMGVCSFMLIGHWWEEQDNSNAALKAFFTTRVGDAGLLIGIAILFFAAGRTFDIARINQLALNGSISHGLLLWAAIALFIAVIGKSAQFPLHTWLPDAMAGPTPVSALIHAATMVVAGVYLVARLYGVFFTAFSIGRVGHLPLNPVAVIGGITVLIAAALAFVQEDIKKVLAYSTVSQLGYMVMALGVGAWTAGIFHLFTHAFFKGLLFLGAGSISHSGSHHSFDMKKDMGGLRKYMPVTFWTFLIGSLALSGIFPLAGFWSKDEILLGAGKNDYTIFLIVGIIGAIMTAAYMARCLWLTFFGNFRGHGEPHESPISITFPLVVLGAFSVLAGFLNAPFLGHFFAKFTINETIISARLPEHPFSWTVAGISTVAALVGLGFGFAYYRRNWIDARITTKYSLAGAGYRLLQNRYYLDHLYTNVIVASIKGPIAQAVYWFNQNIIDGIVNGVATICRLVARFVYGTIDQKLIDGLVNGSGVAAEEGGGALRVIQSGRVQQYAAILFGAVGVFGLALVLLS